MRPLHSIIATFGPETEEPEIVKFEVGGIAAGDADEPFVLPADERDVRVHFSPRQGAALAWRQPS